MSFWQPSQSTYCRLNRECRRNYVGAETSAGESYLVPLPKRYAPNLSTLRGEVCPVLLMGGIFKLRHGKKGRQIVGLS